VTAVVEAGDSVPALIKQGNKMLLPEVILSIK
jgi:hypothetical protein